MKKTGNQKKEKKADKNSKTADKNIESTKQLSNSYLEFCKLFASSPLHQIMKRFEKAIENGGKYEQIILSSTDLNSANISAISESFRDYTELMLFSIWNSPTPFHIIKLLVFILYLVIF